MLNKEKFKDEIFEIACSGNRVAVGGDGVPVSCKETLCRDCIASQINVECGNTISDWANSEYEEYVDWSKVPVDTKILVRDTKNQEWERRHFAGVDRKGVWAFAYGRTSFTSDGRKGYWKYAKLYTEEEE